MVLQEAISALNRGWDKGTLSLSHHLFILSLKVLACSIWQMIRVKGWKLWTKKWNFLVLLSQADDMTCFLRNKSCYEHLISSLECFSKFSGLKLNEEKTEFFFCLGAHNLSEWLPNEIQLSIQILGVHFDYYELSRKKANFEAILRVY